MNGQEHVPKPPVNEDLVTTQTVDSLQKDTLPQNGYTVKVAWKNRRKMAWVSLISMIVATALVFFVVPVARLKIIGDVITWFYFAMTSVVGAYMGFTTWASIKGKG